MSLVGPRPKKCWVVEQYKMNNAGVGDYNPHNRQCSEHRETGNLDFDELFKTRDGLLKKLSPWQGFF